MSEVKRVVRKGMEYWDRICELKRYGFIHSQDNSRVLKVEGIGSWIDMYEAQNVVDAAQHEINERSTENESLREQLEDADEQVVALEKQVKALMRDHESIRKDSERYQFLKLDASRDGSLIERLDCNIHPSGWDRAIDSALSS